MSQFEPRVRQAWVRGALAATVLLAAFVAAASGCRGPAPAPGAEPADAPAEGPILVGEFGSMTGSEATFGQSTHAGIMLAVVERNAAGGVRGRPIEVRTYDDQGKTQEAGTAVTRLITDDHAVAILGEVASSLSIAGGEVAQRYRVPMISPSSTNPRVTAIGDMIFRVCFLDPFQGYAVARFAREHLGATRVATLYDQSQAYSTGLKDNFREAITRLGGTVVTEQPYSGGDQDFNAQLTTIRDAGVDALFVPGYYTDAGNIAIQARRLGLTFPLLGGDGWDSAQLAAIAGEAIEGSYYSNHYSPDEERPVVQEFVDRYRAAHGRVPDGLAALGYDAARILFDAMDRASSLAGGDLAAAIAATRDFQGVTGVISIDAERNARKSAVIVRLEGGVPTFVTSIPPE
jgi:branched-chain amino acid transport system substrate-binding protein